MHLEIISKFPSADASTTPMLFIHGACHGAWCWDEYFLDYFTQKGFACHAISLRGHGKSEGHDELRWASLAHYAEDVARVAARLPCPPVVIGHSMGCAVVLKYLTKNSAPAAVLLAPVPVHGVWQTVMRFAVRHPLRFMRANLTMNLFPMVDTPGMARETLFSGDLEADRVEHFFHRLQGESYRAFLDILILDLPKAGDCKTPMLVLGAAQDRLFRPREIAATARAYNTEAVLFPRMGHDMMLDQGWQQVADHIIMWLAQQGI